MEHGEIDLNERLRDLKDALDENFLRVIWTQMLQAVHAIHSERIIHGTKKDQPPSNTRACLRLLRCCLLMQVI